MSEHFWSHPPYCTNKCHVDGVGINCPTGTKVGYLQCVVIVNQDTEQRVKDREKKKGRERGIEREREKGGREEGREGGNSS